MIIEESFAVDAPRDATAALLLDINRVSACVPGVEQVREVGPGRYEAILAVRLGPIKAAFAGSMELDHSQAPARLLATGEGRDRASGSVAKVGFAADLEDTTGGRTTVHAKADVTIRGRLGQFGSGVIMSTGIEMVPHFADCVNASIGSAAGAAPAAQAATGPGSAATTTTPSIRTHAGRLPATPGMGRIIARGLLRAAAEGFHRLARLLSGWRGGRR